MSASTVLAQKPAGLAKDEGGVIPWLIAGGIVILVCATAFINPKRSHLG